MNMDIWMYVAILTCIFLIIIRSNSFFFYSQTRSIQLESDGGGGGGRGWTSRVNTWSTNKSANTGDIRSNSGFISSIFLSSISFHFKNPDHSARKMFGVIKVPLDTHEILMLRFA